MDRQMDRQTETQIDGQADRQIGREKNDGEKDGERTKLTGAFYVGNGWLAGGCWDDYSDEMDHSRKCPSDHGSNH